MSLEDKKKFQINLHFILHKICDNGPLVFGICFRWFILGFFVFYLWSGLM